MTEREQFEQDLKAEIHRFPVMMLGEYIGRQLDDERVGPMAGFLAGLAVGIKSPETARAILDGATLLGTNGATFRESLGDIADDLILNWAKWNRFAGEVESGQTIDALYTLARSLGKL